MKGGARLCSHAEDPRNTPPGSRGLLSGWDWMGGVTVLIPTAVPGLLGGRRSPTSTQTSGAKAQLDLVWTGKGPV